MRFWVSWWTRATEEERIELPVSYWISGQRDRNSDGTWDDNSICALIDAESEGEVTDLIYQYFPDAEMRFCEERPMDEIRLSDRFPVPTGGVVTKIPEEAKNA